MKNREGTLNPYYKAGRNKVKHPPSTQIFSVSEISA